VLGNFLHQAAERVTINASATDATVPLGRRINVAYKAMDIKKVIDHEIEHRKGRIVISCKLHLRIILTFAYSTTVCANSKVSDEIRQLVQDIADDTISLKELDFRPWNDQLGFESGRAP